MTMATRVRFRSVLKLRQWLRRLLHRRADVILVDPVKDDRSSLLRFRKIMGGQ